MTQLHRDHRERVAVILDNRHGAPLTLVKLAVEALADARRDERRGRGTAFDEVWCVFDVDEHPDLVEAKNLAAAAGINVAVSNPCIELWFVLHLDDQTAHVDRQKIQRRSNELFGFDKRPTPSALHTLNATYPRAKARAIALDAMHQRNRSPEGSNPSTTIPPLVDSISA